MCPVLVDQNTCRENYYCIGDAAGFVDPIFSHGVQNAFYNAAVATMAITESLKNTSRSARYAALCENRVQPLPAMESEREGW